MEKCDCYEEREECIYNIPPKFRTYGVCLGTKEQDRCSCGADPSKCDFYESVRKKAEKKMNTAEMWLKAQEDGKVYECIDGDIAYSKEMGLVDKENFQEVWELANWDIKGCNALDELLGGCEWREKAMKLMTRAEAEKEYQIKIVD